MNDPGFARPDLGKFNGKAMTYYGRWTYKYEEASRQGALGAIIIHDTAPAAYPWSVVENSWTGPQQDLASDSGNERVAVEGWITLNAAKKVFTKAGLELESAISRAAHGPLQLTLGQTASIGSITRPSMATATMWLPLCRAAAVPMSIFCLPATGIIWA